MTLDPVRLFLDNEIFDGWTEVTINRSIENIAGSFSLTMLDIWGNEAVGFSPDVQAVIKIGDDTLITGYLDQQKLKVSESSNLININGRSKTMDLIDCSAENKPGSWTKPIELLNLIKAIAEPYGVNVTADGDLGEKVKTFSITTGESPFSIISKLCVDRGLVPLSTPDGNLVLTTIGRVPANDKLVYGSNVVQAELTNNYKERFSKYILKGQQSGGGDSWGKKSTNAVTATATDENITRNRVKILTGDSQLTNGLAQKRINWEAQVRAGRGSTVKVTLDSWRQTNGKLWTENLTAFLNIPKLRIDGEMLIKNVEYKLTDSSRSVSMECVDPIIYQPEPPKKQKKKARGNTPVWK